MNVYLMVTLLLQLYSKHVFLLQNNMKLFSNSTMIKYREDFLENLLPVVSILPLKIVVSLEPLDFQMLKQLNTSLILYTYRYLFNTPSNFQNTYKARCNNTSNSSVNPLLMLRY